VLDQGDADDVIALDFSPGSDSGDGADSTRRKLLEFARRAEALTPVAKAMGSDVEGILFQFLFERET
jgi:hypothetical protein